MDPTFLIILCVIVVLVVITIALKRPTSAQEGVSRELYNTIVAQNEMLRTELSDKEREIREAYAQLAARDQSLLHLQENLHQQKNNLDQTQQRLKVEFENLANRLLEEKSQRFTTQNAEHMQSVLSPLREKIKEFELNIERKFLEETREKSSLKKEIEQLFNLNQQLSQDAHRLTSALKGESKVQGDWGELQLEVLLEKAGLLKGTHFTTQASYRDEQGAAKRPDFIIQLPEKRQLIVDAKVSLTAFELYHNEPDPKRREIHLKAHVDSIRRHVQDLSSKNYQLLYQINSPDYLLLFVPLENALHIAAQADPQLLTDALDNNVLLVSTGSLIATMRTVAHLWKQEKQTKSVLEIARQSGLLYDKFVGFVDDLRAIGIRLDSAQSAYSDALNKLVNSPKFGDTLIGRAERLKQLGAKTSKSLPPELMDAAELLGEGEESSDTEQVEQ